MRCAAELARRVVTQSALSSVLVDLVMPCGFQCRDIGRELCGLVDGDGCRFDEKRQPTPFVRYPPRLGLRVQCIGSCSGLRRIGHSALPARG